MRELIEHLNHQRHSPLRNYIVPGLISWRISAGESAGVGSVRMFEMTRHQEMAVMPHSHRFNFHCLVLTGEVQNTIWSPCHESVGDFFEEYDLVYTGTPGLYEAPRAAGRNHYQPRTDTFKTGQTYGMEATEVHSIRFSKGAKVLFFEGPALAMSSVMLQPVVDGVTIEQFKVEPWMFQT